MARARKGPPPSRPQAESDERKAEIAKAEVQLAALRQQEVSLSASAQDAERMAELYRSQLTRCLERQAALRRQLEG